MMKFSVAMCVYIKDNPEWFRESIESLLNQTILPTEIVIVVDGPVGDEIVRILKSYEENPIFKIIRLKENLGHGNARKIGINNCSNEYIAIMDSDDICVPDRFETQMQILEKNPDVDIVGGQIEEFIGTVNNIVGKRIVPCSDTEIKEYLKKRCPFNLVTVMFKKESVKDAGGFLDWYCEEDYYLWIRMYLKNMTFANTEKVLCKVRVGKEMYRRRGGIKYFQSEKKLQKYMLENRVINKRMYCCNVIKRFIVQILLPNKIRGWVFKKFARE